MSGPEVIDRDEYGALLATYFEAFPNLSFEVEETIAEGDRVSVRWPAHGTHEGDLMDIPRPASRRPFRGCRFSTSRTG